MKEIIHELQERLNVAKRERETFQTCGDNIAAAEMNGYARACFDAIKFIISIQAKDEQVITPDGGGDE